MKEYISGFRLRYEKQIGHVLTCATSIQPRRLMALTMQRRSYAHVKITLNCFSHALLNLCQSQYADSRIPNIGPLITTSLYWLSVDLRPFFSLKTSKYSGLFSVHKTISVRLVRRLQRASNHVIDHRKKSSKDSTGILSEFRLIKHL